LTIAVHPQYRQRRLGSALLLYLLEEGGRLGAQRMFLEVRASNLQALRLYARLGFQKTMIRQGYYSDNGEDALVLVRKIGV